ncbi:MAG: complex I NDUFA9 subunit family protein [Gammaproteobacteria bacterium]|nr:complex I NDUFA9 subunit family protein [Gammaproteobacteria bacterium]
MKARKICILGGSGFVGRHLVARLAQDKHQIKVLTRRRENHRALLVFPSVQVVSADVHDLQTLRREFAGYEVVINLVGILNETGHSGKGFHKAHIDLSGKVVVACQDSGVHRLLHMSALGAEPSYAPSYYLRSKGEGENVAHSNPAIITTSFAPSVIFGPDDSFFNRFAGLLKISPLFFPLACPDTRFAPIYVGDVAEAYARALNNRATFGQRYNLCGPKIYTLRELVQYTADSLGLKRNVFGLSKGLSRLQANLLEWVPGKPFSRDNFMSMQKDSICEKKFPEVFGITPRSIESTVPVYLGKPQPQARYNQCRRRNSPQ